MHLHDFPGVVLDVVSCLAQQTARCQSPDVTVSGDAVGIPDMQNGGASLHVSSVVISCLSCTSPENVSFLVTPHSWHSAVLLSESPSSVVSCTSIGSKCRSISCLLLYLSFFLSLCPLSLSLRASLLSPSSFVLWNLIDIPFSLLACPPKVHFHLTFFFFLAQLHWLSLPWPSIKKSSQCRSKP